MSSRIPEEIKQYRPGPSTIIKAINGHYYVYMYEAAKLKSGRWGTRTGKCIGSVIPGEGFRPNDNYELYRKERSEKHPKPQMEYEVLDYGQYRLARTVSSDIYDSLKRVFPPNQAAQIYVYCILLLVGGPVYMNQIQIRYPQSWLAYKYRDFAFTFEKGEVAALRDTLGRNALAVTDYERAFLKRAETVFLEVYHTGLKENLLVGFDPDTEMPVFAHAFTGDDSQAVENALKDLHFSGEFYCPARVEYASKELSDDEKLCVFRDYSESEASGVTVLLARGALTPEEVFLAFNKWERQGLAFLFLITGQIRERVHGAVRKLHDPHMYAELALTDASALKMLRSQRQMDLQECKQTGTGFHVRTWCRNRNDGYVQMNGRSWRSGDYLFLDLVKPIMYPRV